MSDAVDAAVHESQQLVEQIRPLLAGRNPLVIGAALADLLAIFLAGHVEELREPVLETHVATVRELILVNARHLYGDAGHPGTTRGKA